jgi:hypothetical protein
MLDSCAFPSGRLALEEGLELYSLCGIVRTHFMSFFLDLSNLPQVRTKYDNK